MSQNNSISDSGRVVIGMAGVVVLAVLAWNGYVFRPMAEPIAVAFHGSGGDGSQPRGEATDLLATVVTGLLWLIGSTIWIVISWGVKIVNFVVLAVLKAVQSFVDSGRNVAEANSGSVAGAVAEPTESEALAAQVAAQSAQVAALIARVETAETTLKKIFPVVVKNQELRRDFDAAATFVEIKTKREPVA